LSISKTGQQKKKIKQLSGIY